MMFLTNLLAAIGVIYMCICKARKVAAKTNIFIKEKNYTDSEINKHLLRLKEVREILINKIQ